MLVFMLHVHDSINIVDRGLSIYPSISACAYGLRMRISDGILVAYVCLWSC